DRCIRACERIVRLGDATKNELLETQGTLLVACWRLLMNGWRLEEAQALAEALAKLRKLGCELLPHVQLVYASVQRLQSDYAGAYRNAEIALTGLSEGDLWDTAAALSVKAFALAQMGRLGDAHRTLQTGIELARKNENAQWLAILSTNLAMVYWQVGDLETL